MNSTGAAPQVVIGMIVWNKRFSICQEAARNGAQFEGLRPEARDVEVRDRNVLGRRREGNGLVLL